VNRWKKKKTYVRVDFVYEHKEVTRAPHTNTWHSGFTHMSNPWHWHRPLPAAPLVVRRRYFIEVPSPRRRTFCVARCSGRCGYLFVVPRPMPARLCERTLPR
jgi:hypothetical protein